MNGAGVNGNICIDFIKTLYCPRTLDPSKLKFEEMCQLSIKDPKHLEYKNPVKWMPPKIVLLSFAKISECQNDYLFTVGRQAAVLLDFVRKGCLVLDTDGSFHYHFGDKVKFDRKIYLQ